MASTEEGGEKPLNASEKAYLKKNFRNEFYFLRGQGLNIYKEEDRSEGRAILRAFQKCDSLPEEGQSPSGANEAAPELRQDNHFRADDRAEETQYQHQAPRGFNPTHGFDFAGSSIDGPAQDPALVSAPGGGEQHQGPAHDYRMNPDQFGYNHEQSGAFDGGYQGGLQGGRQDGYYGGRDDGYVGGYSSGQANGSHNPFAGGPNCHHEFLDMSNHWHVEEFSSGHDGSDNLHDAGYDDGYDHGHDDGYDHGYDDGYDCGYDDGYDHGYDGVYDVEYTYGYQDDDY
ncbi:unnamed protein product [Clonostachys rhizophaga]|uniref:Uncharacterized protein n=1 Tax=Clonostachys rhizophaga TaxID=160324 RepID=A0A9N9YKR0_9HYPO|nr:unnamed protein product [Clonostachys rhizophaga]